MKLTSSVFSQNQKIPTRFTGEGLNLSPPLEWSSVSPDCKSFAIICEDPDVPKRPGKDHPFVHWMIYNLSGSVSALPEGVDVEGAITHIAISGDQGKNSFGRIGYGGPMPPIGNGSHRYIFTLYALDA